MISLINRNIKRHSEPMIMSHTMRWSPYIIVKMDDPCK